MGLRINNNTAGLFALRNINKMDQQQIKSMQRLASGKKIESASDDPSGLGTAELLRAQIKGMGQAIVNAGTAKNLISTAETALAEVNALLIDIRSSVIAVMNSATMGEDQVLAEQAAVDSAIMAIGRIAGTTRYGDVNMLNGQGNFNINTTFPTAGLANVLPRSLETNRTQSTSTFTVDVTQQATQANIAIGPAGPAVAGGDVQLSILGSLGQYTVSLSDGATAADVEQAMNDVRQITGVFASGGSLFTEKFGRQARLQIRQVGGTGALLNPAMLGIFNGTDATATVNGSPVTAEGNLLHVANPTFTGTITLLSAPEGGTLGRHDFEVDNKSAIQFQLHNSVSSVTRRLIGLQDVRPGSLGNGIGFVGGLATGGFLDSLLTGNDNDLAHVSGLTDPATVIEPVSGLPVNYTFGTPLDIVDEAQRQISGMRAFLGSFIAQTLEPNINSLEVATEDLSRSESEIRDVDFARETAELARAQVLFQAGISVLGQATQIPQIILQLLQQ